MSFISQFFQALTAIATAIVSFMTNLFEGVISLFYDGTTITDVGYILFIGLAFGLFFFVLRWIRGLIRARG